MKFSQTQCPTTAEDREKMKDVPYASAIGSIMYTMLCTRPDVCLDISLAGRYQSNPGVDHWTAVKNILKYLKRTKDMFLVYGGDKELFINGYVNASFDTDLDDSKSETGYIFILNGGAVSWCNSKQSIMAGSTCEAEYIAASEASMYSASHVDPAMMLCLELNQLTDPPFNINTYLVCDLESSGSVSKLAST